MHVLLRRSHANDNRQRLCLVKPIGYNVGMVISDSAGVDATVEIVGALINQRCNCAFIKASLHMDAFASLHLVNESSEQSIGRVQARHNISNCEA